MSTIGGVPEPVSTVAGSSTMRAASPRSKGSASSVFRLLPASMPAEPGARRKSPPPAFTKVGAVAMLPVPARPPCTQVYVTDVAPWIWFATDCEPPVPVFENAIEFCTLAPAPDTRIPAPFVAGEALPTTVQSRIVGFELLSTRIAPPPPAPVAVLPVKRQLTSVGLDV